MSFFRKKEEEEFPSQFIEKEEKIVKKRFKYRGLFLLIVIIGGIVFFNIINLIGDWVAIIGIVTITLFYFSNSFMFEEGLSENNSENYEVTRRCRNCNEPSTIDIPIGIKIEDYLEDNKIKCENCGVIFKE